jgi:hypothetical protein
LTCSTDHRGAKVHAGLSLLKVTEPVLDLGNPPSLIGIQAIGSRITGDTIDVGRSRSLRWAAARPGCPRLPVA